MKDKLILSITLTALTVAAVEPVVAADANTPAKNTPTTPVKHSGKCASGKCGTEKLYSKVAVAHNPDEQLVLARDGKCGVSGKGHDATVSDQDRFASGVCGQ
jgi:uncharacterized low-complexity protein